MGLLEELRGILGPQPVAPAPVAPPARKVVRPLVGLRDRGLSETTAILVSKGISAENSVEREEDPDTIAKLRTIARDQSAMKITGVMVDAFSASAAIQVYDGLSDQNRQKMGALPIRKLMDVVFKMLSRRTA